jgi:hypothetical protein
MSDRSWSAADNDGTCPPAGVLWPTGFPALATTKDGNLTGPVVAELVAVGAVTITLTRLASVRNSSGSWRWKRSRYSPVWFGFIVKIPSPSSKRRVSYRTPSRPCSSPRYVHPEPRIRNSKRCPRATSTLVSGRTVGNGSTVLAADGGGTGRTGWIGITGATG